MRNGLLLLAVLSLAGSLTACGGDDVVGAAPDGAADATQGTDADTSADAGGGQDADGTDSSQGGDASDSGASGDASDAASPNDSGSAGDAADAGSAADASDGGFLLVNGCKAADYVSDIDASTPTITFPMGPAPAQYQPSCVTIKAGQSVLWTGSFTDHPLEPAGGSPNNPITVTSSGTSQSFAFPTPGTYGFDCQQHPNVMFGAVQVVP